MNEWLQEWKNQQTRESAFWRQDFQNTIPFLSGKARNVAIVWILSVHQRPMCYRLGPQLVVLLGGCANFKGLPVIGGVPLNGVMEPHYLSLPLFVFFVSQLLGECLCSFMCFLSQDHKQWGQPTMDWTLQNCESKEIFFLYNLVISGIYHSDGNLPNTKVQNRVWNPYGFKMRSFLYLPKCQRRGSDITPFYSHQSWVLQAMW